MKSIITYEDLAYFAYSNDKLIEGPVRGIVVEFSGLNQTARFEEKPLGTALAAKGILMLSPYLNPWNWMNKTALAMTEELLAMIRSRYALPVDAPVVVTGGSMGGLCALMFARYAQRAPIACVVSCPICDLFHYVAQKPERPRMLYGAYHDEGFDTYEEALTAHSPLYQAKAMPKETRYVVYHCEQDQIVNIDLHSAKLVEALREEHQVTYHVVPDCGHCQMDEASQAAFEQELEKAFA